MKSAKFFNGIENDNLKLAKKEYKTAIDDDTFGRYDEAIDHFEKALHYLHLAEQTSGQKGEKLSVEYQYYLARSYFDRGKKHSLSQSSSPLNLKIDNNTIEDVRKSLKIFKSLPLEVLNNNQIIGIINYLHESANFLPMLESYDNLILKLELETKVKRYDIETQLMQIKWDYNYLRQKSLLGSLEEHVYKFAESVFKDEYVDFDKLQILHRSIMSQQRESLNNITKVYAVFLHLLLFFSDKKEFKNKNAKAFVNDEETASTFARMIKEADKETEAISTLEKMISQSSSYQIGIVHELKGLKLENAALKEEMNELKKEVALLKSKVKKPHNKASLYKSKPIPSLEAYDEKKSEKKREFFAK